MSLATTSSVISPRERGDGTDPRLQRVTTDVTRWPVSELAAEKDGKVKKMLTIVCDDFYFSFG